MTNVKVMVTSNVENAHIQNTVQIDGNVNKLLNGLISLSLNGMEIMMVLSTGTIKNMLQKKLDN